MVDYQDQEEFDESLYHEDNKRKKMIKIIIIVLVLVLMIVVIVYAVFRKKDGSDNKQMENAAKNDNIETTSQAIDKTEEKRMEEILAQFANDKDRDGLSAEKEKELGTSDTQADTDWDGITDKDEVEIWGTDPLKADTDGDGYSDGFEVNGGYNPKGQGKL